MSVAAIYYGWQDGPSWCVGLRPKGEARAVNKYASREAARAEVFARTDGQSSEIRWEDKVDTAESIAAEAKANPNG